jgi:hypothetical protein
VCVRRSRVTSPSTSCRGVLVQLTVLAMNDGMFASVVGEDGEPTSVAVSSLVPLDDDLPPLAARRLAPLAEQLLRALPLFISCSQVRCGCTPCAALFAGILDIR